MEQALKSLKEILENSYLLSTTWDAWDNDTIMQYFKYVGRVKIVEVMRGSKKASILLYYSLMSKLE